MGLLGGILPLRQVGFFEISIKFLIFFIPYMTYFKTKFFHLSEGPDFKIYQHKKTLTSTAQLLMPCVGKN